MVDLVDDFGLVDIGEAKRQAFKMLDLIPDPTGNFPIGVEAFGGLRLGQLADDSDGCEVLRLPQVHAH